MKQILIFLSLIVALSCQAQEFKKTGTTAGQFLKTEVGARALGMAGCFSAVANDASALYWNPAGIANIQHFEATFTHTEWIADIKHGFVGLVVPLGEESSVGLSATYQTMDRIEQTTIDQPTGTGIFYDANDFSVGVSYARSVTGYIHFGVTAKMIYQSIWNEDAMGFATDIGLILDTGVHGFSVAMVMTNFGTDMKLDGRDLIRGYDQDPNSVQNPDTEAKLSTEPWPLPTNLRLSISNNIVGADEESFITSAASRLTGVVDVTHPNDNQEHYNIGFEFAQNEQFFGRIGYRGNSDEEGLTLGAGVHWELLDNVKLKLDYAYADFGIFENVQHFTIGIQF